MTNLTVAYKSQWDADASQTIDDCGPACIAMILNYYGEKLTTDAVYKATGAGKGLINIQQMLTAISSFGYTGRFLTNQSIEQLRSYIDRDMPVIALVHYADFKSKQDDFTGGHFFGVVGWRDDGFFVNDPDFWGNYRKDGDHHFYTLDEFIKGWGNCYIDKNPNNSMLVIERKPVVVTDPSDPLQTCLRMHGEMVTKLDIDDKFRKSMSKALFQGSDAAGWQQILDEINKLIGEVDGTRKLSKIGDELWDELARETGVETVKYDDESKKKLLESLHSLRNMAPEGKTIITVKEYEALKIRADKKLAEYTFADVFPVAVSKFMEWLRAVAKSAK